MIFANDSTFDNIFEKNDGDGDKEPEVLIVIPARLASNRFPRKVLANCGGKPLVVRTALEAKKTGFKTVVTSPDREVILSCQQHGVAAMPTSPVALSGTDRAAELVRRSSLNNNAIVIVWQADEPFVMAESVVSLVDVMNQYCCYSLEEGPQIATFVHDLEEKDLHNPNCVKAAVANNFCHWFSRAAIGGAKAHCGVYGFYGLSSLYAAAQAAQGPPCRAEDLEQLAWLEHGAPILACMLEYAPVSVNVPEDLL